MQSNFNFVTDGSKVYRLGDNDWYAVMEDEDKVMLVDTDCKIGDEELRTPWSDGNCCSEDGENGQSILDYVNRIADKYFSNIKHAIEARTVDAGTGSIESAYMWPMSKEEFEEHTYIGGKIACNSNSVVWTRTFSGIISGSYRLNLAWYVYGIYSTSGAFRGDSYDSYVSNVYRVAPAFYLRKSAINHITDDGEIVLKPVEPKGEFVTGGSKVYRLGGNDWYAVKQDDDKVMLVDTDCKIGDEELKTPWSDGDCRSKDGKNGQCILDYVNDIADKYFSSIKYAIEPRTVDAGTGGIENAYMWPMSCRKFEEHKIIGGRINENSSSNVWTRTFSGSGNSNHYAWYTYNANGDLSYGGGVSTVYRVAPAFYLKKSAIDHISDDGEIVLKPEEPKGEFVTDGSVKYHLAGNDWYAVVEDDDKIMLVDTDCKVGDKELKTPWSDGDYCGEEGENGQTILDYTNNLADTYFENIKYAIMPRTVETGTSKLEDAYMWPMSKEEFRDNKLVGGKIVESSNGVVWTRAFGGVIGGGRYAWGVYGSGGGLGCNVGGVCRVAPAFYLKKSAIDHITEDGEIVLKPADTVQNTSSDAEKLLFQVREYAKTMADVNRFEQKLAYAQGNDVSALKAQEMVDVYERILYLATNITD